MSVSDITQTKQYLTFTLDNESYGIDVAKVREILDLAPITKVPRMPPFMRGVINLRGNVVPVIDLRLTFGMSEIEEGVDTCIIIVEVLSDNETVVLGALADSVNEVIDLRPDQIEPPPRMGTRLHTDFIKGMGKYEEKFLTILDIDKVFGENDLALAMMPEIGGYEGEMAAGMA